MVGTLEGLRRRAGKRLKESPLWMRLMTSKERSSHLHLHGTPGYGVSIPADRCDSRTLCRTRYLQDVYVVTIWYSRGRDDQ